MDSSLLTNAASEFASYPGVHSDASVKEFLGRFPLPTILSALQSEAHVPEFETVLVSCLERIFRTKYGTSLIPQYMSFVRVGLQANSQMVRCLACNAVSHLLENVDDDTGAAVPLVIEYDIYPLLVNCLLDGNEPVAAASMDAIQNLSRSPKAINIIFPANSDEAIHLKNLATHCSSVARIRVLALIAKLFSVSRSLATVVCKSNLLGLFEAEVNNTSDMLMTLSALELLYELAESPHGTEFLLRSTLLQLLTNVIGNTSLEPTLRSRAIMISGRLLSSGDIFTVFDENSVKTGLLTISRRLEMVNNQDTDECETALEALGQIGDSIQGAVLLLSSPSPVARNIVDAAFDRQGRGKQLAALHALANISGASRSEDRKVLNDDAEECLRSLIYTTAANSSKLTPSGLLLSVLQQESEIRLAAYRLISGLVAREWCLLEVCSKQEIINIVIHSNNEATKNGMEARYYCCMAIGAALSASNKLRDAAVSGIAAKVEDAVRRGPYLAKGELPEAQPAVVTADRF